MATGTIKGQVVENLTVNMSSNFSGGVTARRMGRLVILDIVIYPNSELSEWTTYEVATINGVTNYSLEAVTSLLAQNSTGSSIDCLIDGNSNKLKVSCKTVPFSASTWLRGQLVFFTK